MVYINILSNKMEMVYCCGLVKKFDRFKDENFDLYLMYFTVRCSGPRHSQQVTENFYFRRRSRNANAP